jgi:methylmalonyl-CoA mutase cobalamin-binding domain/chain
MIEGQMTPLIDSLLDGDAAGAAEQAEKLRKEGITEDEIILEGIEKAMIQLDAKCTVDQFNLLEIMLCGRAAMTVIKELYPSGSPPSHIQATVVLASLKGDIHDLGKNIVKMILTAMGYRVIDCGKDCAAEKVIETAEKEAAAAVGISGLITTIIPQITQLRDGLSERGLGPIKILAGGAALKQASAENLGVDFVAENAFDGLHYLDTLYRGGE